MTMSFRNARLAAALALAASLSAVAVRADVVILKDGYTLHGLKTVKEKGVLMDENGNVLVTEKPNGMTAIDDGPRWVVFSDSRLQLADVGDANRFKDFAAYTRDRDKGDAKLPSSAVNPTVIKDWDHKEWTRVVEFRDALNATSKHTVRQHINVITPHYLRTGSSSHILPRYFLLHEFQPSFIRSLLINHPDLLEKPGVPDAGKRERLVRFWIQAEWFDESDRELEMLISALPAEKERHARLRSEVNGLRAEKLMGEIERARDSGRHQFAIRALAGFPKDDVPRSVATKATAARAEYETRTARFDSVRRLLAELAKKVDPNNPWLAEAATIIAGEVHLDTLSRLDMFGTLADRAEKDAKEGRRPTHSTEELLASAVTGWHLGKVSAETKVATAYKCWMTRQMALDYLRDTQPRGRARTIETYQTSQHALPYDELEKLISLLPPPDAPPNPPQAATFQLAPTVEFPSNATYHVRLPEEYQPGRPYPVLIALPDPVLDGTPETLLARLGDLPAANGYIVAVPQWWEKDQKGYTYTKEEQGVVTQMLRQLRRTYQVDSDRIFLFGHGEGGALALDLAGSHPDIFAGVAPVNPTVYQPLYIPAQYWVNFHQMPVYLIMGDKFGPSVNAIRMLSERWMPRGYPAIIVSYKGRALEWFSSELPYLFDWMGRKRRADPGKTVGPPAYEGKTQTAGFSSVRVSDNRFHWLSSTEVRKEGTLGSIKSAPINPVAKFSAKIVGGNTVEAKAIGVRNLTVWFGKGMLDYSKPVRLKVNDLKIQEKKVTPQIPVLMEDLYDRGDRQRPYFEKAEFKLSS